MSEYPETERTLLRGFLNGVGFTFGVLTTFGFLALTRAAAGLIL